MLLLRDVLNVIIDIIEDNLYTDMDLDELSKKVGYSRYHMCKIFRSNTGLSINQYKIKRRLTEAAKMVLYTDESLLEISLECGFPNDKYFSRVFKEKFGIAPSIYRKGNCFLVLTNKIIMKEKGKMKFSNTNVFIKLILECVSNIELINFISSVEDCVLTKQSNSCAEVVLILYDDNGKGKKLVQLNIDIINGRYVEKLIYDGSESKDVELIELNIIDDKPIFYFYDCSSKRKSKVTLEVCPEHRIELGTIWKEFSV